MIHSIEQAADLSSTPPTHTVSDRIGSDRIAVAVEDESGVMSSVSHVSPAGARLAQDRRSAAARGGGDSPGDDEVYGNDSVFRAGLENRGLGYIPAVTCSMLLDIGPAHIRADPVRWRRSLMRSNAVTVRWCQTTQRGVPPAA